MRNKIFYILPLLLTLFVSCKNETESTKQKNDVAYFGGNIINPVDTLIYLIKSDSYFDEPDTIIAKLDKNNFFLIRIDSLKEGAYTFNYGEEFQFIYLEKNDSLMLRLNTLEFDESLVFTGKGATINNYLIKRYLHNEEYNINLYSIFSLNQEEFIHKTDSIKNVETKLLEGFNFEGSDFSPSAFNWAKKMLTYTEYSFKELYPLNNTIINKRDSLTIVDDSFYAYRSKVKINDSTSFDNKYFRSYVNSRVFNMTIDSILKVVPEDDFFKDKKKYNIQQLNIQLYYINNLFSNTKIKDYLMYRYAVELFNMELSIDEVKQMLIPFYENVTNKKLIEKVDSILSRHIKLAPGSEALDFEVFDGKKHKMFSSYFGKPIYLFFWLSLDRYSWNKNLTKNYNELKKQYPNIQFISVYIDFPNTWEENVKLSGGNGIQLSADYQVIKQKYLIPSSNSFVLIDENGKIIESNTFWPSSRKIKMKLDELK